MTDPVARRNEILARVREARRRRIKAIGLVGAGVIALGIVLLLLGAPGDFAHGTVITGIVVVGIAGAIGMFGSVDDGDGDPDKAAARRVGMGFGVGQEAFREAQQDQWGMGGGDPGQSG